MKTIAALLLVFSSLLPVRAADTFQTAFIPTAQNERVPAEATFTVTGATADFAVRFGLEGIVPNSAVLSGHETNFTFDLGSALIVVHSPGGRDGWPNGYDGATMFSGSLIMPEALRQDFVNGNATLLLSGTGVGDFRGTVVPVLGVQSGVAISWPAVSTNFILQSVTTLATSNAWVTVTNRPTVIGSNNIVTNLSANGARFYRLKRL